MANEHSQIVPSMQPTATVADFKFWCQKVLPLVYDDSLSYYEVLNKMVVYLNQVIDNINADIENVEELEDDFLLLQDYVNNFFDDIDQLVTYAERAEAAETAALSSAASAAESATNAASSAVNAATSSGSAATSALSAMDAKDAAVAAKTAAETALASAQTAATNAAASATAAGNSATAASGSATNAAASAASALQNFQLSDTARVAAQEAAEDAQDILDSIPEDYSELVAEVTANDNAIELKPNIIFQDNLQFTGTYQIPVDVKPGQTINFSLDSVVTDAGTDRVLIVLQYEGQGVIDLYIVLNTAFARSYLLTPTQQIDKLYFYAGNNYSSSVGKTATYTNLEITIDTPIKQAFTDYTPLIADTFVSFYSEKILALNDLFIIGNKLYKATDYIAAGAKIIVGTNAVETSIAEVIKNL